MKNPSTDHQRRSIRLKGYDYSLNGAYFVTICTQNHECLFGDIMDGQMRLHDAGLMVQTVWDEMPIHYPSVYVDAFQIMPNHIHGIIVLSNDGRPNVGADHRVCPGNHVYQEINHRKHRKTGKHRGLPLQKVNRLSLPDVVKRFKNLTTKKYIDGVKQKGWVRFNKRVWQRNYYEHIIRSEDSLDQIREYIIHNPLKWDEDELYKPIPR